MFTGILGHALRNPLAAIMSGAYLALNRTDREELVLPLTRIATNGERLVRMIDQLLDFNRVQVGAGMPIESSHSDLAQALGQVVDELDDTNPDCVISLDHAGGETEGDWDADRLAQVFSNLVANAVRHGDREHGVQVCIDGKQPDLVRIEVHNRGTIPENLVPKLFEPLAGGERRRDQAEGLGLGLHISHEIVKAHRGQIEVRSSEAEGTTFAVLLPRSVGRARMQIGSTPTVVSAL
jgi:signal transduction histidine kinase